MNTISRRAAQSAATLFAAGIALGALAVSPASSATTQPARPLTRAVTSHYAPKGRPMSFGADRAKGAARTPHFIPRPGEGLYLYSGAAQGDTTYPVLADGARGYYTIAKPVVAPGGHSLAEISVSSADERQTVEVGWTVDRALNGDDDPHLFVYHWINDQPTCYNACGFVPISVPGLPSYAAGMKLPVSSTPAEFYILHHGTAWVVGYNNHAFGYFPDSEWTNPTFKVTGVVQWFGEVNTPTGNPTPCTQMGNGELASSATAARVEKIGFWPARVEPFFGVFETDTDLYTVDPRPASVGFRFGGPGACTSVPNLIGGSRTVATGRLAAAGLVTGNATPVTDWLCEDLNNVLSQAPAPGTQLSRGSAVSFTYGVPPRTGCPNPRA